MDTLSLIKQPIETELGDFIELFNHALDHEDGLLQTVLNHIKQRAGKRMRPILILLVAKNFGQVFFCNTACCCGFGASSHSISGA